MASVPHEHDEWIENAYFSKPEIPIPGENEKRAGQYDI